MILLSKNEFVFDKVQVQNCEIYPSGITVETTEQGRIVYA